jgi:AcrR family transcriptional regulator
MPALPKTSDEKVVRAARKLLERHGGFVMMEVARAVGVRPPSLYKRFPDREALIDAVVADAARELGALLAEADRAVSPLAALNAMAHAFRGFAKAAPTTYSLLFIRAEGPSLEERNAAVAPLLARLTALVGAKQSLSAARLLTAWLHGFVSMEAAGAFQLGGDIDQAFEYGLATVLGALRR